VKETGKIKYIKKNLKNNKVDEIDNKVSEDDISNEKNEETKNDDKTGWWS